MSSDRVIIGALTYLSDWMQPPLRTVELSLSEQSHGRGH